MNRSTVWHSRTASVLGRAGAGTLTALALVVVATNGAVRASAATTPALHVKLTPTRTTTGSRVTAAVAATLPSGDHFAKGSVSWGDGGTATRLTSLPTTLHHRYRAPGRYAVVARMTDTRGNRLRATATERVIATPGSYSGTYTPTPGYSSPISFFLSANPIQVQDVRAEVNVTCTPGGGTQYTNFVVDAITLGANGTFSTTAKQTGVFAGSPATIKDTITGRVTGLNSAGQIQASGTLRVSLAYSGATAYSCTSGTRPWKVFRDSQPTPQPSARPKAGSYSGVYHTPCCVSPFTGYVSADRSHLQDLSSSVDVDCSPGNNDVPVNFVIDSLPIAADGSFAATSTDHSVYLGSAATLTFTLRGHFHGVDANGVQRAAGSLVARLTYDNGAAKTCTSNKLSYTLLRDAQPTHQPSGPPPAGDYSGTYHAGCCVTGLSFSVVTGPTAVQNLSTSVTAVCAPGNGSGPVSIALDTVPVKTDGSFTSTTSAADLFNGNAATIDVTVVGHTHGINAQGHPRLAGSLAATVTYTNGATYHCSAGPFSWSATGT